MPSSHQLSTGELHALPPVVDVTTAARALGVSAAVVYELIRRGEWPTPVLRLGKRIRIPKSALLDLILGVS